ncbi:MAG TPA: hypothetical protein VJT75_01170 [Thermoleophilaceae bacterium]|nr:hypothetical protein [Thermoleophilaceae bacterium]
MPRRCLIGLIAVALTAQPHAAAAAPGGLNRAFSDDGVHVLDLGSTRDHAAAMAIQPDGKIVVAGSVGGDAYVARLTDQGAFDPDFGSGGIVTAALGPADVASANGVAIQGDGGIVVGGYADVDPDPTVRDDDMVVARFDATGTPDAGFGDGGRRAIPFGGAFDQASGLALQPDGKIVVAGRTTANAATGDDIAVARLTDTGELDAGFDDDGRQTTAVDPTADRDDFAAAVAIGPGPNVLVAGETTDDAIGAAYDAVVVRYNDDGTLDGSWAGDGIARLHVGSYTTAASLAALPGGGALIGGATTAGDAFDPLLARFTASGEPNTAFGNGGRRVVSVNATGYEQLDALAVQPDGRILGVGYSRTEATAEDMIVLRYSPRGDLDLGFNGDGRRTIAFDPTAPRGDFAFDLEIAADGASALIAGRTAHAPPADSADSDLAFVSLLLAGPADADYDGVPDTRDICPNARHATAIGCPDADGDRVQDRRDAFPHNPAESADTDHDGIGNRADTDDDNDGAPDATDLFPRDRRRHLRPATAGPDTIVGTSLGEQIDGRVGDDTLYGLDGSDVLRGGPGADVLRGGNGKDILRGGTGRDSFDAGAGNDTIEARDGLKETVDCGTGAKDVAVVDETDVVTNCNQVERP